MIGCHLAWLIFLDSFLVQCNHRPTLGPYLFPLPLR